LWRASNIESDWSSRPHWIWEVKFAACLGEAERNLRRPRACGWRGHHDLTSRNSSQRHCGHSARTSPLLGHGSYYSRERFSLLKALYCVWSLFLSSALNFCSFEMALCLTYFLLLPIHQVRFNLDPFNAYSDASVWASLEATQLKSFVADTPGQLEARVTEGGSTWSAGQRQLLSLARALLHRRSLVLLDEATASVDHASDQRIQRMLHTDNAFAGATLVVIAHRIDTILDSDVVLVLEHGQLVEMGPPQALIVQNGAFAAMVTASKHASKEQKSS